MQPQIFRRESEIPKGVPKRDVSASAFRELFFIEHPHKLGKKTAESAAAAFASARRKNSVWVYLPWRNVALRIPRENYYYRLRTARNRNLINEKEQKAYRACAVGIAGLSVGSAVLATLVATGGPKRIRLADPDVIEITNLNRMRATLTDVGDNKTDVAARLAWELDPFAELEPWREGVRKKNMNEFVSRLDVFVDEMDDIALKFAARESCRREKVPVIMATDNGDGVILDVERFDLEPERAIFHGRIEPPAKKKNLSDRKLFIELSNKIIGVSYLAPRQYESILAIGKELSGIPQLATAAALAGAAAAFAVRQIAIKSPMPSGRYVMSCERAFAPNAAAA